MFSAFQTFGRLGAGGLPFSERALWPNGASSPGLWIDGPSYPAACYQDSAGTTALSTVGTVLDSSNPVGLVLDRKGGLVLGPELVTNGDFSNGATGWSAFTGLDPQTFEATGGQLHIAVTDASRHLCGTANAALFNLDLGKTYKIVFTINIVSGTSPIIKINNGFHGTENIVLRYAGELPIGSHTITLHKQSAATGVCGLNFDFNNGSNPQPTEIYVDNISVREIPGIHLSQSTSAARPVASARVNLLTYSEDFSNAVWTIGTKDGDATVSKTPNYSTAPDGTTTACRVVANKGTTGTYAIVRNTAILVAPNPHSTTSTIWMRSNTGLTQNVNFNDGSVFNALPVTPSWQLFTFSRTTASSVSYFDIGVVPGSGASIDISIWHPQQNLGSVALPYQRVGAASDYDTTGFPVYTKFDGTDDALSSATFSAGTLTSSMDCLIALRRDSTSNTVVGLYNAVADATKYFGMAESGSSSGCVGSGAGTPTVWVDGVQLTGGTAVTRGTLHTALTAGAWHIVEFRGLDLSTWTAVGHGLYTSYVRNGALGKIELFASGQDANRDKARARMAAYFGVTLP